MSPPSLLLLFLLTVPAVVSVTQFVFSGDLICGVAQPFNAIISVYEKDYFTPDDFLYKEQLANKYSPAAYNFTAFDNDDGKPFDDRFELVFDIVHNCNQAFFRQRLMFREKIAMIWDDNQIHHIRVADIDLSNRGEPVVGI